MGILRGSVLCAISALYLATAAPAQEGGGFGGGEGLDVDGILYAGTEATISYSNPEYADQVIVVAVYSETGNEASDYVLIELNGDGEGQGSWAVEDWDMAVFSAQGAEETLSVIMMLN